MPNGKPADNPLTDMLVYGRHPFPADMEEMILRIHKADPSLLSDLGWEPFEWEVGKNLEDGRERLREKLRHLKDEK
jgi:hypothetical protein